MGEALSDCPSPVFLPRPLRMFQGLVGPRSDLLQLVLQGTAGSVSLVVAVNVWMLTLAFQKDA